MRLSVVILSFNTRDLLGQCLRALRDSLAGIDAEVFVVDSSSTDGSIELVRDEFPEVRLIVTPTFGGFAHANNIALRQAQGEYNLLLNSDAMVSPDTLSRVLDFMDSTPKAGAMGPRLVKQDGSLDLACRRSFPTPEVSFYRMLGLSKLFPRSRRFGRYNLTFLPPDQMTEVDSVCGAFMLVRKAAIEQVGLLDESFYFYGEDLDWAFRIKQGGWQIYYYPAVEVLHLKGQTSRQQSTRLLHEFYEAMRLFYRKHYAADNSPVLRFAVLLGIDLGERWAMFKNALRPSGSRRVST